VRAILTYHSIDESGSVISLPPSVFAQQVTWLRSGRVRVTSIPELLALPPDADAVTLTFDDGFCNFATEAAPLLRGLPVTLFVVTDHVGRSNDWHGHSAAGIPTMPLLDWESLGRLADAGVELGAHTRTHPDLRKLTASALEDELSGSAARLAAETGIAPDSFAYPYGSVDPPTAAAVARTFRWACTSELRSLEQRERAVELPRLDMYYFRQPGQLESWGSPAFHAYLACRRLLRQGRRIATRSIAKTAALTRARNGP
jgi:peptidoglycan/xylan/chitin deacetylase (PgdA/CDA1 family)